MSRAPTIVETADGRRILAKVDQGSGAASARGTTQRFHAGRPPHAGWWLTLRLCGGGDSTVIAWRWWNAGLWSVDVVESVTPERAATLAVIPTGTQSRLYWSHYWPADARVPRVDPAAALASKLDAAPTKAAFNEALHDAGPAAVAQLIRSGYLQAQPAAHVHHEMAERDAQATSSPVADVGTTPSDADRRLKDAKGLLERCANQPPAGFVTIFPADARALCAELARLRACEDELKIAREAALVRFTQGAKENGKQWKSAHDMGYRAGHECGMAAQQVYDVHGHDPALMPHFHAARRKLSAAAAAGTGATLPTTMVKALEKELAHLQATVRTQRRDLIKATDDAAALRTAEEDGTQPPITIIQRGI